MDRQFPSSPNIPTIGYKLTHFTKYNLSQTTGCVGDDGGVTMRHPSITRLQVSAMLVVLLLRNSSHPESFLVDILLFIKNIYFFFLND